MNMIARTDCLRDLSALIDRADPEDLGAAQNLLLRFGLSLDGTEARLEALDGLHADLSGDAPSEKSRGQQAFHAVLLEMIERTKIMVGPSGKAAQS